MEFAVIETADRHRVFVANLSTERARLSEADVMGFRGVRPQTTQGCVVTNLQCSLSRSRMVFAVTRRRRTVAARGRVVGRAVGFHIDAGKSSSTEGADPSFGA